MTTAGQAGLELTENCLELSTSASLMMRLKAPMTTPDSVYLLSRQFISKP